MQFEIRETKYIPYYNSAAKEGLADRIKKSSEKRKMNLLQLIWHKKKKNFLQWAAKHCKNNDLRIKMHRWRGVNIGQNVYIAKDCTLDNSYPEYIYIEDNAGIANEVVIIAHTNPDIQFKNIVESCVKPVIIRKGAWIGTRSVLLRGVTIGEKSIVCAGTIVDKNVEDKTIVQGNPMKKIVNISKMI